jgi:hypothetical protein
VTGSAGLAATITITGQTGRPTILSQVDWSYSSAPTGGNIKVQDGSTTIWEVDVTAAGPGFKTFTPPLSITPGANMVITLAAPGGAIVGKVDCYAWVEQ